MHKPIGSRVLIRKDELNTQVGRLFVPEHVAQTEQDQTAFGTVLATGPGLRMSNGDLAPMFVKPGDRVFYMKYQGQPVDARLVPEGESYVVCEEQSVLLILDPEVEGA